MHVADVLLRQAVNAIDTQALEIIKIKGSFPQIHHLFFADDLLFFIKAASQNIRTLKSILNTYCRALGKGINLEKSSVVFGSNTSSMTSAITDILDIHEANKPVKYLGFPTILG